MLAQNLLLRLWSAAIAQHGPQWSRALHVHDAHACRGPHVLYLRPLAPVLATQPVRLRLNAVFPLQTPMSGVMPQWNTMSGIAPRQMVTTSKPPPMNLPPQMDAMSRTAPPLVFPAASQSASGPAPGLRHDLAGQAKQAPGQVAHAPLQQQQVGRAGLSGQLALGCTELSHDCSMCCIYSWCQLPLEAVHPGAHLAGS